MDINSYKTGFITLIGRPNVGKSTLMNNIIGQKIAITSNRPQTTRNRIQTVYTDDTCQMIFLDTPGIHESKNKLGEYMLKVAKSTLEEVDVILWLVEPSTFIGAGEQYIIEQLRSCKKPVILVINKIDTVEKSELEKYIAAYKAKLDFADIIPVSAKKRENIDTLVEGIKKFLPFGPPFYDEDTITDQPERQIAGEIIREKALRLLKEEVPHGIAVTVETMRVRGLEPDSYEEYDPDSIMDINATIICERDSHKMIIIGKKGSMIKKIGTQARKDIEKMVGCRVNLQIWVKVRKDWRDDMSQMKNFGYDIKGN
ncbi:MAG: GTPase Era [Butyrivibrio sp.]|nr:GTPase Era [Butyrivibrio sp.]